MYTTTTTTSTSTTTTTTVTATTTTTSSTTTTNHNADNRSGVRGAGTRPTADTPERISQIVLLTSNHMY